MAQMVRLPLQSTCLATNSTVKMETETIPVRVHPTTVKKLQADVAALTLDVAEKQKIIDKLQVDLGKQDARLKTVEAAVVP